MTILGIDAANRTLAVALKSPEGTFILEADAGLRHSERLMCFVDDLFAKAGLVPGDLDAVACMAGPGSFTGLRIGIATAKGLAVSLDIPFVAVSTLDCLAAPYSFWPGVVLPVIDAKKGRFYAAPYRAGLRIGAELDADPAELAECLDASAPALLVGPDAPAAAERLAPIVPGGETALIVAPAHGRSGVLELIDLGLRRYRERGRGEDDDFGPVYLRKSEAELARDRVLGGSV